MIKFVNILYEATYNSLTAKIKKIKNQEQANEMYAFIDDQVSKGKLSGDDAGILNYNITKLGYDNPKFKE